jgi:hypothetical protein
MLRKFLGPMVALVMLAAVVLPTTSALAAPPDPGSFLNASGVPAGSVLCLNITYKITNDEDSGNVGYWALDNYNKSVQVWQVPDGSFYAIAKYEGKDGSGTFHGGYVATFTADSCTRAFGNVGSSDFGGTKADVLLGTYGAGQVGPTVSFDWTSYFPGFASFVQTSWGWTYKYRNQSWNNFDSGHGGTTGDIVF